MRAPAVTLRLLCACGLAVAISATAATPVYRWTDDEGRIHYGEQVPDRYRDRARPLPADPTAPSAEQQREAEARAARDKARAAALPAAASRPPLPRAEPPASAARVPAQAPGPDTDCDTWQRLYDESTACFGPYRTVRGATRPEAFERCTPVDQPPSRCRQAR